MQAVLGVLVAGVVGSGEAELDGGGAVAGVAEEEDRVAAPAAGEMGLGGGGAGVGGVADEVHGQDDVELVAGPGVLHGRGHPEHGAEEADGEERGEEGDDGQLQQLARTAAYGVGVVAEELLHERGRAGEEHEGAGGLGAGDDEVGGGLGGMGGIGGGRGGHEGVAVQGAGGAEQAEGERRQEQQAPERAGTREYGGAHGHGRQLGGDDG
ncbi:hypothetical protein LOY92_006796, partial [Ophidiomyces ophidiicola]